MDSHTRSAQVERLDVVETGRRRRWSEEEKLKIELPPFTPDTISSLLQWRRSFRTEQAGPAGQAIGFVPAMVVPQSESAMPAPAGPAGGGAIEIELASRARMRITGAVDAATLRAAIAALTGGQPR